MFKLRLAVFLKALSYSLFEAVCRFADRLYPAGAGQISEVDQSRMLAATYAVLDLINDHPCPECRGQGALIVSAGTDAVACHVCRGLRVDPAWIAGQVWAGGGGGEDG